MQVFDNFDDMITAMQDQERKAIASLVPQQTEIQGGDHWVSYFADGDAFIFGRAFTLQEAHDSEVAAGGKPDEVAYSDRSLADSYDRGYLFGWAYSVIEPNGELGSTHKATMLGKISEEMFERARQCSWDYRTWFDTYPDDMFAIRTMIRTGRRQQGGSV